MAAIDDTYLNRKDAARFLSRLGCGTTARFLRDKAYAGGGPPFNLTGKRIVRYAKVDLEAWAKANTKRIE